MLSGVFGKEMQIESVDIGKNTIKRMLCRRNVLIVLDDVDHIDQLNALAGCHAWFGDGSRIIITTRDQHLLLTHKVDEVYPLTLLSQGEGIRLFRRHAYHENNPVEDYEKLSLLVVSYVNGLPLALKIMGSFLYDKNKDEWLSTLSRLKDHPEMDIVEKLKISYDGLTHVEKELFLDIACFFRGRKQEVAMEILDACGFHSCIGVKVLIQKALITVSKKGYFDMHDLVQETGHYIVRGEHLNNPEKYSRVWLKEDIEDICSRNATTENDQIEGIRYEGCYYPSNFIMLISKMKKLRFLEVITYASFDEGPTFLSNELRYFYWESYSASVFPESFQPTKLAILKIEYNLQKELWKGYKELRLINARVLVRTPYSLEEIHQSLGNHNSIVYLRVKYCDKLTRFPNIIRMEKVKILKISWCKALVDFPKIEAKMDNLIELALTQVGIEVLPSSVGEYCTNLISLKLKRCGKLKSIEGNFHALKCLEKFALQECNQFEKLPTDLLNGNLDRLRLQLPGLGIGIQQLILPHCLRKLNLSSCHLKDGEIPKEVGQLSSLRELDLSGNYFTQLDFSLSRLISLKLLLLSSCCCLVELPELPSSLAILRADYCRSLNTIVRDDIDINCKCLCEVSIRGGIENKVGWERLIKAIFQGNSVESGLISLHLNGFQILKVFEPNVVKGKRYRMELPENWYNDFSGFLFYIASNLVSVRGQQYWYINMKHEKSEGGLTGSQDDLYLEKRYDKSAVVDRLEENFDKYHISTTEKYSWVGYIPFGSLRNTLWWQDHTSSTAIQIEFDGISGCGCKLIPKRSETTNIQDSSSSLFDDVYTCGWEILSDTYSTLKFCILDYKLQSY